MIQKTYVLILAPNLKTSVSTTVFSGHVSGRLTGGFLGVVPRQPVGVGAGLAVI